MPGFPLPFGDRRSLLGSSCARRRVGLPHGQPTRRACVWTPTGLSRSARDSYDRGGCPLYPGGGGALPPGQVRPGGTRRLTATGPYLPLEHPIERESFMTKRQRGFTQFTRPVFPSLWPPDGTAALGHFLGLRTPRLPATHAEAGTVLAHWTGRYVSGISRTSFDESHCLRATFVSHHLIQP